MFSTCLIRPNWTLEKLRGKHPSNPHNPLIANAFFRAGYIEAWGRGIERILAACHEANFPEPEIEYETSGLWVNFRFADEIVAQTNPVAGTREKTREKILRLLRENQRISMDELADSLGLTRKGVEWQIQRLKTSGKLKRIGPDKGGYWEVAE